MMATCTHLSNDQMDDILLETAGIKRVGRPKGPSMKPVQCEDCSTFNVPGAQFCYTCGRSLTNDSLTKMEQMKRDILKNPDERIAFLQDLKKERDGKAS